MKKIKSYIQKRDGMCGPACLKMVLSFYGIYVSEEKIAKITNARVKTGTTAKDMIRAVKNYSIKGTIKDFSNIDDIKNKIYYNVPVMVNWWDNDGHYSVVSSIEGNTIYLHDPQRKKRRPINIQDFNRNWFDFEGEFLKRKNDIIIRRMIYFKKI